MPQERTASIFNSHCTTTATTTTLPCSDRAILLSFGARSLVTFKVSVHDGGLLARALHPARFRLFSPRPRTATLNGEFRHRLLRRGATVSTVVVAAPGIFRVHKHLAAFSASVMRKRAPPPLVARRKEEYNFLSLARPCLLRQPRGYRTRVCTRPRVHHPVYSRP